MWVMQFCFKIYFKKCYQPALFYDWAILADKEKESKIKRVDNCRPKFQRKYLLRPDEFVQSLAAVLCEALSDIQLTFVWLQKNLNHSAIHHTVTQKIELCKLHLHYMQGVLQFTWDISRHWWCVKNKSRLIWYIIKPKIVYLFMKKRNGVEV